LTAIFHLPVDATAERTLSGAIMRPAGPQCRVAVMRGAFAVRAMANRKENLDVKSTAIDQLASWRVGELAS